MDSGNPGYIIAVALVLQQSYTMFCMSPGSLHSISHLPYFTSILTSMYTSNIYIYIVHSLVAWLLSCALFLGLCSSNIHVLVSSLIGEQHDGFNIYCFLSSLCFLSRLTDLDLGDFFMDFCRTFTPVLISLRRLSMIHHDELEQNVYCGEYLYIKLPGKYRYTSIVFVSILETIGQSSPFIYKIVLQGFPFTHQNKFIADMRINILSSYFKHKHMNTLWTKFLWGHCVSVS